MLVLENTFFRLLALGASPNFADQETGNTPLHIAAKEGQALQIELLWLYGADVGQKNAEGHTARDLALLDNHVMCYRSL
jgi:G protein-coupled receptor kinase interacting protein 2